MKTHESRVDTSMCWRPPSPFDVVLFNELIDICRRRLTGEQRDVFEAYMEGCTVTEISDMEGVGHLTVTKLIGTAQKALQNEFGRDGW
jgi:DNA-directed RNA polymerase specialized sigma24 family protein